MSRSSASPRSCHTGHTVIISVIMNYQYDSDYFSSNEICSIAEAFGDTSELSPDRGRNRSEDTVAEVGPHHHRFPWKPNGHRPRLRDGDLIVRELGGAHFSLNRDPAHRRVPLPIARPILSPRLMVPLHEDASVRRRNSVKLRLWSWSSSTSRLRSRLLPVGAVPFTPIYFASRPYEYISKRV